jgi:MFS family permease
MILLGVGAVLASLHAGRVARSVALAFLAGVVVAVLFGTNAPNTLYSLIADQFGPGTDPGPIVYAVGAAIGAVVFGLLGAFAGARNGSAGDAFKGLIGGALIGAALGVLAGGIVRLAEDEGSRPMVVGLLLVGTVLAVVGLVVGARTRDAGNALTGLVAGFVLGAAIGAFSAITFSWHVAVAIGIAVWFALALALMAADVAAHGIDTEALKSRFYPQATIDTTKETIEWAKARIPRGPAS